MEKKKTALLLAAAGVCLTVGAQTQDWDGVTIVEQTVGHRISADGTWIMGESVDGGTVTYNRITNEAYFYPYGDYGHGNCISNNGWAVGSEAIDNDAYPAFVMVNGEGFNPGGFKKGASSRLNGITPDGSRVCGTVGDTNGLMQAPIYCDVDASGNFGEVQYLPTPSKDMFGQHPMSVSALWISEDGGTIAGQVRDSRGFYYYPIVFKQQANGEWEYSFPAENQFNKNNMPIPDPVRGIEYYFPDAPYPELENFMTEDEWRAFQLAGTPYGDIIEYMTPEEYEAYTEAEEKYLEAQMAYEDIFWEYMDQYWAIVDSSLNFVYNNMALSLDGNWLAASADLDSELETPDYAAYLCNLSNEEWTKISPERGSYLVNQAFAGGIAIINSVAGVYPSSSYVYISENDELMPINDFICQDNPEYTEWFDKYTTNKIITGVDEETGEYEYSSEVTVTGIASMSEDFSVVASGVDGYYLEKDMYFTYIMSGLYSGVEEIEMSPLDVNQTYRVYNLQGVKMMESKMKTDLQSLPKGIYIINGKKVKI